MSMISKSGYRFSSRLMLRQQHDLEKWAPVFGHDHAQTKSMIARVREYLRDVT